MAYETIMRYRTLISIHCVVLLLITVQIATAQTKSRVIPFPAWSIDETDSPVGLELVEIRIAGKPIALDTPFDAGDDWLKNITLTVKNIGDKPIVAFSVGGGLLNGISEELPVHAYFKYGITWKWGNNFNPDKEKHHGPLFNVGDTVELSYANVDLRPRGVLAKEGEGAFSKLKFMLPAIQYSDGSSPCIVRIRFPKGAQN